MSQPERRQIEQAIQTYIDPYLHKSLLELKAVRNIRIEGSRVEVEIRLGYPADSLKGAIRQILTHAIEDLDGVEQVEIKVDWEVVPHRAQKNMKSMEGVKNIIAVASGKGGVGKSTTTANLALALAQEGARVGILDADIYGPSMGLMMGIPEGQRPGVKDEKFFIPIEAHGIQVMSMAFLVNDKTPMVWRGPMVSGAMQQLLTQSLWNDLDFLLIDMPPGTGDIQLTLAQKVPVTGAVIVTTPQDIALLDCKKGIEMFRRVDIPVLGVVENMSYHHCSNCGHHEPLFGEGGGARIADEYGVELLGALPLHVTIREQMDAGKPTAVAEPDSEVAMIYRNIARKVGALLSLQAKNYANPMPEIIVKSDA